MVTTRSRTVITSEVAEDVNENSRNIVIFALIAVLVMFGWPLVMHKYGPKSTANPPVTRIEGGKTEIAPNPGAGPAVDSAKATQDRATVLAASPRVRIDTPTLKGSINLKGARIDDLVLSKYAQTIAKKSPPIRLLSPSGTPGAYFASFGWRGEGVAAPGPDTLWHASGEVLSPGHPVTLTADNGQGQRFRIDLAVDDQYMFTVRQSVANIGQAPVAIATYALVNRSGASADPSSWMLHTGPMLVHNGAADYDVDYKDVDKGAQRFTGPGGWYGFSDQYWLTALIPDQAQTVTAQYRAGGNDTYQADYTATPKQLAPGKQMTQTARFFAGAKEVRLLDHYQDQAGVPDFGKAVDWGWFEIVEKPIFYYLDWLFRLVGNFGVAIILLTVTIRGLMFPIAQRQFASMAKMRAMQPKMKAIQERYKDDKPRQQQEIMALYKTEGANPLAGCLPTLLQIPVFYALYKVLRLSIEMRHQPFVLWIKDLSAPDPLTPLNLFGLLHYTPPHVIAIGVVPILLGVSMYFQFKLNPAPMDDAQKQVFAIMPWVFMFVMASYAVGLQLYWITSNCLAIAQQQWLYSRHPELKTKPEPKQAT
ncbi:membrane protein insertase YidC [Hephaestia mangrovi]|uniref:membrane protein insertase YidC n=1 Tax=Hephaestia mangrovi TaxID=2873268 RepID=UPI0021064565|nr:membrane protein insertase YidC [Hephaestia mangrovi]